MSIPGTEEQTWEGAVTGSASIVRFQQLIPTADPGLVSSHCSLCHEPSLCPGSLRLWLQASFCLEAKEERLAGGISSDTPILDSGL